MPSSPGRQTIAVIGAAGFVGRQLLHDMEKAGLPATAVIRGAPEWSIDGTLHRALRLPDLGLADRHDVVVNLAYPTTGSPVSFPAQNQVIFRTAERLLKDGGHLIHVSTQAVFGLAVDRPIQLGPVAAVRDDPYVEAKVEAEKHFEDQQKVRGQAVEIVRLGNVWGRASGAWALPIVQRLLTGRPIGVSGVPGFSNATDVANVAAYLIHLLNADRPPGVYYHHLAEFSAITWDRWVAGIARELAVEPVYVEPDGANRRATVPEELALAFASVRPRNVYRHLAAERTTGSWLRSALRLLPEPLFSQLKGPQLVFAGTRENDRAERTFLAIMCARQEFKSQVLPGWCPPVTEAESMERVVDWLRAG